MFGEKVRLARKSEFPFVVSIKRMIPHSNNPENNHICTGTLVSIRDVVTAGHCNEFFQNHVPEVIVGTNNIRRGSRYYVSWWLSYNQWTEIRQTIRQFPLNDITMLRV
jgi:V8-like Glu-specific endopeptidase